MRVPDITLNRYKRTNKTITLYRLTYGNIELEIAAYTSAHARDILEDYDSGIIDLGNGDQYTVEFIGNANSTGVKSFVVYSENY